MRTLLALSIVASSLVLTLPALAADDCPSGSIHKSENGFEWCEPTVCMTDGQCGANEVCRPVGLCMQVGSVGQDAATLGEAGKRLVVTQRCAPDKKCPDTTTCSELGRCLSRATAERMGLMNAPAAGSASAAPASGDAKKSSCGCSVPGIPNGSLGLAGLALAATSVIVLRRARRK